MSRDFVIWTGVDGAKAVDTAIKEALDEELRKPIRIRANLLLAKNKIDEETHSNYIKMINSPDLENLYLAESLITIKE